MQLGNTHEYAKMLINRLGLKAELAVTNKIKNLDIKDENNQIERWQKIRLAIREMRGPRIT